MDALPAIKQRIRHCNDQKQIDEACSYFLRSDCPFVNESLEEIVHAGKQPKCNNNQEKDVHEIIPIP